MPLVHIGMPLIQTMIKLFSRSCQRIGKFYNSRSVMMSESLHEHQHDSQIQHLVHTDARPYHMGPIIFVEEELFWWYLLWHARNFPSVRQCSTVYYYSNRIDTTFDFLFPNGHSHQKAQTYGTTRFVSHCIFRMKKRNNNQQLWERMLQQCGSLHLIFWQECGKNIIILWIYTGPRPPVVHISKCTWKWG